MRSIGFLISPKENENRRALLPVDVEKIQNKESLYFQKGYGEVLGISDYEYLKAGANIASKDDILKKDIICDPKIGDAGYLSKLKENQILFGWIHAVQNLNITNILLRNKVKCIAWEDMYEEGRHVFWRNNEIAGEAAIMHAFQCYGKFPYETKAAILGRGNTAKGAYRILNGLGSEVTVYGSKLENLFKIEMHKYDVIINAVLWDVKRRDHIINKDDLKKLKDGALIIDISCDSNKAIETSISTTIQNPTYSIDGITHYVVDHTPSLFFKTATKSISKELTKYIDILVEEKEDENTVLSDAIIISNGNILDEKIIRYQNRENVQTDIA
ncbi:N(5)-(carboxyethyl)ornithine synthase [Clostridium tetani]|uniref:N(5)-(carboxyethyl)ornithine synthase n=1 Tax=Clostridium tetani TaxID=1513 RepID=UPI002953A90F|nr:N(5)-(carboxyethyl)ornithine synthase [Clostridium tetani]BDR65980.1 N(5)-(carboxyethyl)ornithine synthase [Clostridium tetani]